MSDDDPTQRIPLRDVLTAIGDRDRYSKFDVWADQNNGPGAWRVVGKEIDTGVWRTLRENLHIDTALSLLEGEL